MRNKIWSTLCIVFALFFLIQALFFTDIKTGWEWWWKYGMNPTEARIFLISMSGVIMILWTGIPSRLIKWIWNCRPKGILKIIIKFEKDNKEKL